MTAALTAAGTTVVDFDTDRSGTQPLLYEAKNDPGVEALALTTVAPAIRSALRRAGYESTQSIDVIAHSTGGLAMRYLVETQPRWAHQVDDLVMVATPNHGSRVVQVETKIGPWPTLGKDMAPNSPFLRSLGDDEPPAEVYTTVAGAPLLSRLLLPPRW